jgi:transcriptional regulator with XRE-family HTH domain
MQEPLRLYLRELRDKQGITQQEAADNIGLSLRAFSDWETGKSDDIKSRHLIRLVVLVKASWSDIVYLETENIEHDTGIKFADTLLSASTGELDTSVEDLIEHLRSDVKLLNAFLVFWAGWKARELA